jgi:hypothetical protein
VIKEYLERLHEMEEKKKQDDAKRRELLLINAKLLQEQKQLLNRSSLQAKEMDRLQEKINSLLLREERHRKFQLQQQQQQQQQSPVEKTVIYCSPPRQTISSPLMANITIGNQSPIDPPGQEKEIQLSIGKNGKVENKENRNPPLDDENQKDKSTEGSDNSSSVVSIKRPLDEEQQQAKMNRPAKRRVSHFMTKTLQTSSTTTEKPSECKQQ